MNSLLVDGRANGPKLRRGDAGQRRHLEIHPAKLLLQRDQAIRVALGHVQIALAVLAPGWRQLQVRFLFANLAKTLRMRRAATPRDRSQGSALSEQLSHFE